jgi:hypothetical protein
MIGAAVGYSCCFGTPFAGMIAAIDLCGKISTIKTMWILYVSLFFGSMFWHFLGRISINIFNLLLLIFVVKFFFD